LDNILTEVHFLGIGLSIVLLGIISVLHLTDKIKGLPDNDNSRKEKPL